LARRACRRAAPNNACHGPARPRQVGESKTPIHRADWRDRLRRAIARIGGKKELTGRTDIELEISNQCGRLIANAIIYYNSAILSRLLTRYEADGNTKARAFITQISPAAWRHILLNGHSTFRSDGKLIDLDAMVAGLDIG
jgi:hypothetical protein